ncbi:MAG: response regulator, partial [Acidimicrobiales bacterium]|nr:response regulator [Acidimicrobiales bacterium]
PEMRQLAADAGARFLVAKPFTADDLQAALGNI